MKPRSTKSIANWLKGRSQYWQRLNKLLDVQNDKHAEPLDEVLELVQESRALARDVSLARNALPGSSITKSLEALFARADDTIYRRPQAFWWQLKKLVVEEIPEVIHDLRGPIMASFTLFVITAIAGWLLVWTYPETISLFASDAMVDIVQRGELWTDDLYNVAPHRLSSQIMTNNIIVSLFAFVLGALYGVGTIYIIGLNGLNIGGIFAYTALHDLDGRLFEFVVAHGVVELSVICLAGAAGIRLGEALIRPGDRSRVEAFHAAVSQAGKLLVVVAILLVGAGIIEGYISPNPTFPLESRVVIGLSYGILMWTLLTGKLWSFGQRSKTRRA